ncbi:MBL fold metallo-hydrolase [Methanocella arvoryzae]|uniref:Metallo-beta-lactamase n=1 Tax=Methanocella arvoryzae (strain DSM 22066 / NBRC 105507 / MRE50) TaxID=351160 RepID=Q0W3H4_METAR|nr:MBL fold metallo-hydrolase [Methanocella arvoryzae]CAJ37069.1 putative metallo-beta-lactamase [Methanocella arvoryzae MRE50]
MSGVTFLGTAGGRMVVTSQLRKSGGFWLSLAGKNILVDPGPGSLMRSVELGLKPANLDCIVLSHKHIDHSNDVNIMIEAMSGGSFRPRGILLAPSDALEGDDPVVLRYVRTYIRNNIKVLEPGFKYSLDGVGIEVAVRMMHANVESYGLKFTFDGKTLGYITDTKYFNGLPEAFKGCDYLIVNMVRMTHDARFEHLLPEDVIRILKVAKPRQVILNHFGMQVVKARPDAVARRIEKESRVRTIAGADGMQFSFDTGKAVTEPTISSFG